MLTTQEIIDGLRVTGERLDWKSDVEIVLAGAAACLITGVLDSALATLDCDVLDFNPQTVRDAVMRAAREAASELDLSSTWLNDDVRSIEAKQDMLPVGWQQRRCPVGTYGKLHVYALDRFDLLATKLFAGRPKDRDHLAKMRLTKDEVNRLRGYLESLDETYRRNTNREQIAKAHTILDGLAEEIGR